MEEMDILQITYEKNHVLSKCQDVLLEARRVILNEELDKIANITLSQVNNSRNNIENCLNQCKNSLNVKDEVFWQNLPNPKVSLKDNETIIKKYDSNEVASNNPPAKLILDELMKISNKKPSNSKLHNKNNRLTKKYFSLWRALVKLKKEKSMLLENRIEQKDKLDNLVQNIKNFKKYENDSKKEQIRKIFDERPPSSQVYKHRFKAQKDVINMQKAKLEEQNKLIEELKLGIVREDLFKSIENKKNDIREIFSNCSHSVKCKVPVVIIEESQQFQINTQKAPKVIQQLEKRALERAQKREIILERKRLIDEAKQKMLAEAIENKRVLEEVERKRNLEVIRQRRKKELELEKIRQANKQKYLESLNKAINFYNKRTLRCCFKILHDNYKTNKTNALLAKQHYETKILRRSISYWCDFVEDTYKWKYEIADAHFTYKLLKEVLKIWRDVYIESVRNKQVAEDIYDLRLTSNTFIFWHRYVCTQIGLQEKCLKIAEKHYKRKLLFHCFYLWRSLPAVLQLEKAKELKKRKWREKVWEILPNYKPPEDI